jgi:hypothetical protein
VSLKEEWGYGDQMVPDNEGDNDAAKIMRRCRLSNEEGQTVQYDRTGTRSCGIKEGYWGMGRGYCRTMTMTNDTAISCGVAIYSTRRGDICNLAGRKSVVS